ncbi:hypothetical protein D3C87_182520 [compost metagenome]
MKKNTTIQRQFVGVVTALTFAFNGHTQTCPTFALGTPVTNLYTVTFRDANGNLLTDCTCQLSSGTFKCGLCLPILWTTYSYVTAGNTVNCINAAVLPVELKSFDAVVSNGDVELVWSTETERNNAEFIIERSEDGIEFIPFALVPGAGKSSEPLNYSLSDTDPLRGVSYYQISQRNTDGEVNKLSVVSVSLSSSVSGTLIAPNPSQGKTLLQLPLHPGEQVFDVSVSDELGNIVRSFQTTTDTQLELRSGVYRVVVRSGINTWSEKVVVLN